VAKILKKKYGHDVVLHKIPPEETNYGIVRKVSVGKGSTSEREAKEAARKIMLLKSSEERVESSQNKA
jgi:hypothetical protein